MPPDMIRNTLRVALVMSCLLGGNALAQTPDQNDLQALRFYLQQENERAVRAELQRLQIQFPDWSPPNNLSDLTTSTGPETIDQIYRHIEAEEFDSARGLIEQTDAAYPDWSPPADLLELLRTSEAQVEFDIAVQRNQPETAISIARGVPNLLSCERINNAWNLAEMHQLLGDTAGAMTVYQAIMTACTDPDLLIATLEKADAIATAENLERLADMARTQAPQDILRLQQTEDRLRAGRQLDARWGVPERTISLAMPAAQEAELVLSVAPATDTTPRPEPRPSETASSRPAQTASPQSAPPQTTTHGNLAAVQAAAQRGAWAECLAQTSGTTRIDLIYERAWCAYNAERPMEASDAFRKAAQAGTSATMRRDAAYGWMLSLLKLNMTEQAAQVLAGTALTHAQRLEIESQILDRRGVRAYEQGNYTQAIAFFDARERLTGQARRDLTLLKGYALLNSGNRSGAREVFMRLHRQLSTPETRNALRAAQ